MKIVKNIFNFITMTLPINNRIYQLPLKDHKYGIVWGQDLFFNVYIRTIPLNPNESSYFIKMNWWKFLISAKYTGKQIYEDNKLYK